MCLITLFKTCNAENILSSWFRPCAPKSPTIPAGPMTHSDQSRGVLSQSSTTNSRPTNWNCPASWCSKLLPFWPPPWPPSTTGRSTPSFDPSPINPHPTVVTSVVGPFWKAYIFSVFETIKPDEKGRSIQEWDESNLKCRIFPTAK